MSLRLLLIIISLFSSGLIANAQLIRGVVRDENQNVVPSVAVTAKNQENTKLLAFNMTDANGHYQLQLTKNDTTGLMLRLSHTGYQTITFITGRFPTRDTTINFVLLLDQKELDTVTITEKKKKIETTSFSADSLKQLYHRNIQQLLIEIPGLTLMDNKFIYKGKVISKILFEGDNLSGENYQHLLKSLSTHSLDSIQLIENFVDKTELGNAFKKYGDEVVINFKFKGKKKVRNFGRVGLGTGIPGNIFEANVDYLSLIQSLKMVNIANYNSKGLVTDYLFEKSGSFISPHIPRLFSNLDKIKPPLAIIAPYTIFPEHIGIERIYRNQSAFLTSDIFNRISQKTFFKGNIRGIYDKLPQAMEVSSLFLDTNFVSTNTSDRSTRRNMVGAFEGSLNWLASPKVQLVSSIGLSQKPVNNNSQNIINGNASSQFYTSTIQELELRENLTWLSNQKFTLKAEIYVGANKLHETSNNASNIYTDLFLNKNITSVTQNLAAKQQYAGAGLSAIQRLTTSLSTTTNLGFVTQNNKFGSALNVFDNEHNMGQESAFDNDISEQRTDVFLENELVKTGKLARYPYSMRMVNLLNYLNHNIDDRQKGIEKSISQNLYFSPKAGISIDYKNQTSFGIDMFVSRYMPIVGSIYDGLLLYDMNRFKSGYDTLRVLANPGISVNLRKQVGIKYFSISYTFSKAPIQQSQTFENQGLFVYNRPAYVENPASSHSIHLSFLFNFAKTSFSLNSYQSFGNSKFTINQRELSSRYIYSIQNLKISNQIGSHISNNLNTSIHLFGNKQTDQQNVAQANTSMNFITTHELNFSFLSQMTASFLQKLILLNGSQSKRENYYFLDSKLTHTSKSNRFTSYFECRNIFNKDKYSIIQQNLFQQVQTYSAILPRMFMIGLEIKL